MENFNIQQKSDSTPSTGNFKSQLKYLLQLQEGMHIGIRDVNNSRPSWLDEDRIHRGQCFGQDFFIGIFFSEMLSLYVIFSDPVSRRPLVYSKKSTMADKAFKRYYSTIKRVKSWLDSDLLDEQSVGFKNLKQVYYMHKAVSNEVNQMSVSDLNKNSDYEEIKRREVIKSSLYSVARRDVSKLRCNGKHSEGNRSLAFSQFDLATTQFAFVGLIVLYPEKFGIFGKDKKGIMDFVYLWRYIGHKLGIEDSYNVCFSDDFEEISMRMRAIMDDWFKIQMQSIDAIWEHMSRVATKGTSFVNPVPFESGLLYLFDCLSIGDGSVLISHVNILQKIFFHLLKFAFYFMVPIKIIRYFLNLLVKIKMEIVAEFIYNDEKKIVSGLN